MWKHNDIQLWAEHCQTGRATSLSHAASFGGIFRERAAASSADTGARTPAALVDKGALPIMNVRRPQLTATNTPLRSGGDPMTASNLVGSLIGQALGAPSGGTTYAICPPRRRAGETNEVV